MICFRCINFHERRLAAERLAIDLNPIWKEMAD